MTPDRLRQIEELYHAARERSPESRAGLLAQADPDLRREVQSLLEQDGLAGPMDRAPAEVLEDSAVTPLAVGAQLGPYRIEGLLGEGGMGRVYRARDTRLGRMVALKIAHERFSSRFEREARAISSLNHPHVCTLHDVGPNYLVMELLEGETLAAHLKRGALPVDQVLRYGAQIADALNAAHRKGITHRDLKPANIVLTGPKGRPGVKVLDFGLAKIDKGAENASGCTLPSTETVEGGILGTLPYMAPEQLQGRGTDARSDIFSLGSVLYELLTGRRAFEGSDSASITAAILKEEPPPLTAPLASGALARLVRKCLAKDPDERWQSASDLRDELLWIASGDAPAGTMVGQAGPKGTPPANRTWLWAAAAALVVAALAGEWLWRRPAPGPAETLAPVTTYSGSQIHPSFSPDGRQIAFSWNGEKADNYDIYVKLVGETNALRLTTDPAADTCPVWTPDGRRIAFQRWGPHGFGARQK